MCEHKRLEDVKRILNSLLSSTSQNCVKNIELDLTSRALLQLTSEGVPYPVAVTVVPTPVNHSDYRTLSSLQPALNLVLDKLSRDRDFIISSTTEIVKHDLFVKGLLDIYMSMTDTPKASLGLHRHDFMCQTTDPAHEDSFLNGTFKMVEVNLIAVSMGHFTEGLYHYHRSLLRLEGFDCGKNNEPVQIIQGLCEGLRQGYELYNTKNQGDGDSFVVLVHERIIEPNYFDHQGIVNELSKWGVPAVRYTVSYILDHGRTENGRYYVDDREVAVLYFRTFYDPSHFETEDHWRVRREMELSQAITVPNIAHQLVNMKLFQMLLTQRSVLERYTESPEMTEGILNLFTETLTLDLTEEGDANARLGIENPTLYVMKPQREGGGNNFWELEMKEQLELLSRDPARSQYILMRRFTPPIVKNKFIKNGVLSEKVDTVSEIGVYSVLCRDSDGTVLLNRVVGPLVRTKNAADNEGGVTVGISAIDSPLFV